MFSLSSCMRSLHAEPACRACIHTYIPGNHTREATVTRASEVLTTPRKFQTFVQQSLDENLRNVEM
jgi:hypothetical protein